MEEYKDFVVKMKKANTKKTAKVNGSWGVYDAYKAIRKQQWLNIGRPVTEHEFYSIIRGVNDRLAENLGKGETVTFPAFMGCLEIRKNQVGASLVNGRLLITYPVNWADTLRLWYEDAEARENKTLLRDETKFVYNIRYNRGDATYENKAFYEFAVNRFIKLALRDNILKDEIDTLWLKNNGYGQ